MANYVFAFDLESNTQLYAWVRASIPGIGVQWWNGTNWGTFAQLVAASWAGSVTCTAENDGSGNSSGSQYAKFGVTPPAGCVELTAFGSQYSPPTQTNNVYPLEQSYSTVETPECVVKPAPLSALAQSAIKQALYNVQGTGGEVYIGYQYLAIDWSEAYTNLGGVADGYLFITVSFSAGGVQGSIGSPVQEFVNMANRDFVLSVPVIAPGGVMSGGGIRDPGIMWHSGYFWLCFADAPENGLSQATESVHLYKSLDCLNWVHVNDMPVTGQYDLGIGHWVQDAAGAWHYVVTNQGPQTHYVLTPPSQDISAWGGTWTVSGSIGGGAGYNEYIFYDVTSGYYIMVGEGGDFWYSSSLTSGWTAAGGISIPFTPGWADSCQPIVLGDALHTVRWYSNGDSASQLDGTQQLYVDWLDGWRTGGAGGKPMAPTLSAAVLTTPTGFTGSGGIPHWMSVVRFTEAYADQPGPVTAICNAMLAGAEAGAIVTATVAEISTAINTTLLNAFLGQAVGLTENIYIDYQVLGVSTPPTPDYRGNYLLVNNPTLAATATFTILLQWGGNAIPLPARMWLREDGAYALVLCLDAPNPPYEIDVILTSVPFSTTSELADGTTGPTLPADVDPTSISYIDDTGNNPGNIIVAYTFATLLAAQVVQALITAGVIDDQGRVTTSNPATTVNITMQG
jgi:hypothetical protein